MPEIKKVLPKYLQIAEHIREQIVRGDLVPGDEVPSERELASSWSVARPTATRALEALRGQGYVESRRGAGTFVRERDEIPRGRDRYERARAAGTMFGETEAAEFLATDVVVGPDHVAQALKIPVGSRVVRRKRLLRGHAGRPVELSTSWFTTTLGEQAPRLLEPQHLPGGADRYIAETTGRTAAYARDQMAARLSTDDESGLLDLRLGAAVLVYRLTVFDADDEPLHLDDAVCPPDRWAFGQEYPLTS